MTDKPKRGQTILKALKETGEVGKKLEPKYLKVFVEASSQKFSEQATTFLNAYWDELEDQAEFIFSVAYKQFIVAHMKQMKVKYHHLYEEGVYLDFNIALYFYEQLCKKSNESLKDFPDEKYKKSKPQMMTALKRKAFLKKVDVNFDGKISFLEYLIDQYKGISSSVDFCKRRIKYLTDNPSLKKMEALKAAKKSLEEAKKALNDVNKKINAYEAEKLKLTEASKKDGVKGLRAKAQLAALDSSKLKDDLNVALIKASSSVRSATKKYTTVQSMQDGDGPRGGEMGSLWWLKRELAEKKSKYGRKNNKKIVRKKVN